MLISINQALRDHLQNTFGNDFKIVYGDVKYFFRKVLQKYTEDKFPVIIFKISEINEDDSNSNTPISIEGLSDIPEDMQDEVRSYKLLPVNIKYDVTIVSYTMIQILPLISSVFFLNYEGSSTISKGTKLIVDDPEVAGLKFPYSLVFDSVQSLELEDTPYEEGYQYMYQFTVSIRGVLRQIINYKILKNIDISFYLDESEVDLGLDLSVT